MLYGVCGGITKFFGISPFAVRLIFFFTASVSGIYFFDLVFRR
ncbi:PspC domain-containing protein [Virgibacillus natechei]